MSKFSRREFISKMGIGTAVLSSIPSVNTLAEMQTFNEDKKLGIALVGLGSYSEFQLAPALKEAKNCYLAGIVTGTPEKAERWKKQFNIPDKNIYDYKTFDRIADNKAIDIIYVVLPNSMHHEFVIRAAKAGKHVICEKPLGLSSKECIEMIDACKKANVKLFVGYRLHFEPYHLEATRVGQKQVYGKVKIVESTFGFKIGDPTQWRLKKALAGGGAMMDLGIYCIQAARYVTGEEPIAVTAQEYKTDHVKFKEVDETITWQMEFPSGAVAHSMTTYASPSERLFISAEDGWLELSPAFAYGPIKGKTKDGELNFPHTRHQTLQLQDFAACILENRESPVNGEEGLKDLKIIEAIYKSIRTGGKVNI